MKHVAIIGSRTLAETQKNEDKIISAVEKVLGWKNVSAIVSGGAKGVDSLAEKVYDRAKKRIKDIELIVHHANWDKYGKMAEPIRNKKIMEDSDVCFAFTDKHINQSKGTYNCVSLFKAAGKEVYLFRLDV